METRGAETSRFPSSSGMSAPRPKGFASSVRLSRAPPPLLQFARPLFNRLSAFSTVHHSSLHLPFVFLSLCISFNLFERDFTRSRDLPLPAPPSLRFDFSLPSIYPRRWSEFIAAEFFLPLSPKGPTCFSI